MSGHIDRRYVRAIQDETHEIDHWHEMVDEGASTLTRCGAFLDPGITMQFANLLEPPRYQHQRGTGFPPGDACPDCSREREWLDLEGKGPIYDDATNHF